ncbi:MAG: ACT domain-containing protein [Thermoproteota archaeon]
MEEGSHWRSVASLVRELLRRNPLLLSCIYSGYANYSEVARSIQRVAESLYGVRPSLSSIKMALVRLARSGVPPDAAERLRRVLAESTLAVQDNVAVVTVPRETFSNMLRAVAKLAETSRFVQLTQGLRTATIVVAREDLEAVTGEIQPLEVIEDQSAVLLISPREIIHTPGVIAFLTEHLARHGVNITQIISCHVETIIVVDSRDSVKAYKLLRDLVDAMKGGGSAPRLR